MTDVSSYFTTGIRKGQEENISAVVHDSHIIVSCNSNDGLTDYNDFALPYDIERAAWVGPDIGYSAGPMISRLPNYDAGGAGELLCMTDGASTRLVQLMYDSAGNQDYTGSAIDIDLQLCKLGAQRIGQWYVFFKMYIIGKLSAPITVTCDTYRTRTDSAVIQHKAQTGGIFDDPDSKFDDAATTFGTGFIFDPYEVRFPPTNKGFWTQIRLREGTKSTIAIGNIEVMARTRGWL
jgi:hypothetical protein